MATGPKGKARFWQRPRAHGEIIEDRTVSFLELFYDLTYVVVIARAAHHLAGHVSWRGALEFAVVFGLIWFAWLNGTIYYDLHGREDGRTRAFVFLQMLILAVLAVFTGDALGENGTEFAWTYVAYLIVLTWLWYSVRRVDSEEYAPVTARYLTGMVASIVVVGLSSVLSEDARLVVWGGFVIVWMVMSVAIGRGVRTGTLASGAATTDSTVERFGLFTIIVLGEVIVGVVEGLSEASLLPIVIVTGALGLTIGFAYWWTYFDLVGQRLPKIRTGWSVGWMFWHLPVTMSIAASGAAMVSLIEHGSDSGAPTGSAWLLSGSVAVGLVGLVFLMRTLDDYERLISLYETVTRSAFVTAILTLVVGWIAPAPWLLTLAIFVLLAVNWVLAAQRFFNLPDPAVAQPNHPGTV